jgi:hypothetical protein
MGSRARTHKSTALPDARKSPTDSVGEPDGANAASILEVEHAA